MGSVIPLFSQRKEASLHSHNPQTFSTGLRSSHNRGPESCHCVGMTEFSYLTGAPTVAVGQWLALAGALDSAALTLRQAAPDPLWFGPSRQRFDQSAAEISTELTRVQEEIMFLLNSGALT